ncbi:MAG: class I SAM-dependent methyltransferase, partial [Chthoniobacterales bacterium]
MPSELPSLAFQPKFYSGGVSRFHLAFLYDLVAARKPRKIVTLGFSDAQIHFTWCQAVRESDLDCQCLTVRRDLAGENVTDDAQWQEAIGEADEFYPDVSQLRAGLTTQMAAEESDGSIDLLLIDDCDRGEILQRELQAWRSKLAPQAVVLFHGLNLERVDSPRAVWREVAKNKTAAEFSTGVGLGILALDAKGNFSPRLPNESNDVANLYEIIAARIDAQAGASKSQRENSALRLRQVWFDTVLADRAKAQQIMDDQAGQLTGLRAHATDLQQVLDDRARKLEQSLHDFDQLR